MNDHALRVLEYDKVREIVAAFAASAPGAARIASLAPSAGRTEVAARNAATGEFLALLRSGVHAPFDGIRDTGPPLARLAAPGAALQPAELLDIASTLAAGRRLKAFFSRPDTPRSAGMPVLSGIAGRIVPRKDLEDAVQKAIDETGAVKDAASPGLRRIRKSLARVRDEVLERLERIMRSARDVVQDETITVRDDRYVIPLKPNFRQGIKGVVHGQSGSRATLFVEPLEVLEQNNRLAELRMDERDEVERILRELTALHAREIGAIAATADALAELDAVHACARFGVEYNGTVPALVSAGALQLRAARHPLLSARGRQAGGGRDAVPNDIEIAPDRRTLIISGPNAGGKTIILKTVGLLCLMAQAGIPITAGEGSGLPVVSGVFADIGDEQSVEADLSTFSSHARTIAGILRDAQPDSLVLFDEMGSGTDPAEGAALASAVLSELTGRGCMIIVTTHHGGLKLFGSRTAGAMNAAMEYDPRTLKPTYRFIPGRPGRSYGLDMAALLGFPGSVIDEARKQMTGGEAGLDRLLEQLGDDSRRLRDEREQAEADRRAAAALKAEAEVSATKAAEEARMARAKAGRETREMLASLRRKLKELSSAASMQPDAAQAERNAMEELGRKLETEQPALFDPSGPVVHDLRPGDRVRVPRLNKTGSVLFVHKDAVEVDAGDMKLRLPLAAVARINEASRGASSPPAASGWKADLREREGVPDRLMLLGMRVDEAIEETDRFIDRASMQGFGRVLIVHGLGTGALKEAVTAFLKAHPLIASLRPGEAAEGGAGVTVAELKR